MSTEDAQLSEVSTVVSASPARVFAELADGWAYSGWVVGATHVRDVDADWPSVGSKIHHKVGSWPVEIADYTEVLRSDPDQRLDLRARGWPMGEALVSLTLVESSPGHTQITIGEAPIAGPGHLLDNPMLRWGLKLRNTETLRRLKDRVEQRELPLR